MKQPYLATTSEIEHDLEAYVDAVYASLESQFLVLPRGRSFIEYPRFQEAYETLKKATRDFRELQPTRVWDALLADSLSLRGVALHPRHDATRVGGARSIRVRSSHHPGLCPLSRRQGAQ